MKDERLLETGDAMAVCVKGQLASIRLSILFQGKPRNLMGTQGKP
ncbi:hypothetical protein [Ferrimonas sediminum]|nr:hypothetical protein [Ferrimonas sediminum]